MTREEWASLRPGSIVSNLRGTNHRVVLKVGGSLGITLPTNRDWNRKGYTVYCKGDRNNFLLVKVRVKIKQKLKKHGRRKRTASDVFKALGALPTTTVGKKSK